MNRSRLHYLIGAAGLLLSACSARQPVSQLPAAPVAQVAAAPATPPLPDSLRLTPVPAVAGLPDTLRQAVGALYRQLGPDTAGLRPAVLAQACVGYLALRAGKEADRAGVLAVADMDLPNTAERLWVLDLAAGRVLAHCRVAHGRGSGHLRAQRFSNVKKSACTSLGFYRTGATYDGKHGLSRYLHGLDPGQNSNAARRYVVLHAADYAAPAYVAAHGHLGYSRGCPALPPAQYRQVIGHLPAGSVLLLSGPGLASRWLDGAAAGRQFARRGWR